MALAPTRFIVEACPTKIGSRLRPDPSTCVFAETGASSAQTVPQAKVASERPGYSFRCVIDPTTSSRRTGDDETSGRPFRAVDPPP